MPVHSSLDGPIESLSISAAVAAVRRAVESVVPVAGRGGTAGLSHRLPGNSLLRPRRRAGLHLRQRRRSRSITCRGTEPNDWNDIRADLDLATVIAETVGRVHRGFKREVDDLWPRLEQALVNNTRTLWFAGHSLGGAMAAICAGRCKLSYIQSNPRALFTYGSPRVGNRRYVNYVQSKPTAG